MNRPLTKQQQAVYDFIRGQILARGYGPTVREIGDHMNFKSPNGVMCHLRALERKGMLTRAANKSRAIELTEPVSRMVGASLPLIGSTMGGSLVPVTTADGPPLSVASIANDKDSVLRVLDDSMLEANIACGDYLIVSPRETALNGNLAVVRSGSSTVVRYWHREAGRVRLDAVDTRAAPIFVDHIELIGVVTAVVRRVGDSTQCVE